MHKALLNLLPALAASTTSLFAVVLATMAIANNLSGFARVRIPSAG